MKHPSGDLTKSRRCVSMQEERYSELSVRICWKFVVTCCHTCLLTFPTPFLTFEPGSICLWCKSIGYRNGREREGKQNRSSRSQRTCMAWITFAWDEMYILRVSCTIICEMWMFLASQSERVYFNHHFYNKCTALSMLVRWIRVACMLGIWGWIAVTQVVLIERLGALKTPLRPFWICSLVQESWSLPQILYMTLLLVNPEHWLLDRILIAHQDGTKAMDNFVLWKWNDKPLPKNCCFSIFN